ncbi:hypothetical protein QBC44DRAFT_248750, partial [Cladorrhinum sp. PSN332]
MAPIEDGFDGDNFSNNLFTDLAPLLTLFGEQVTKQFVSLSLSWVDNVLLAAGPLGITTVVVSAIRVGGSPLLKSLVGRAREERAVIEQELLSSTSDEVCELWNGNSIVRTKGRPANSMTTLIITDKGRILSLEGAVGAGVYCNHGIDVKSGLKFQYPPPNLTLNLRSPAKQSAEIFIFSLLGIFLQAAGLAVSGLAHYQWGWAQSKSQDQSYAYPLYIAGTLLLFLGVMGCGRIVESATSESHLYFTEAHSGRVAVVRLQDACIVGDQLFPSVAIFNPFEISEVCVSVLDMTPSRYFPLVATILTMTGFVIQFIGLRNLHWSASIMQLGITLTMTVIRAYVRRGLS